MFGGSDLYLLHNARLLLGTEAPVMTPDGVDFAFLSFFTSLQGCTLTWTSSNTLNMVGFLHAIGSGHHAVTAADDKHQLHKCIQRQCAIMLIEMIWLQWN